jgi:hypothetical protein
LVAEDWANPRGYFEDLDIVRFHQRVFARLFPRKSAGHADWGWTPAAQVTAGQLARWRPEARALVQARMQSGRLWGFKDPRATVVLDFWHSLLPNPVYVAVYRSPTLVADSMQRLAAPVFLRNPEYAWPIWRLYNQRLLDFIRRHRERCLVLNVDALPHQLDRIPHLLHDHLGLTVTQSDLSGLFDPQLLRPKSRLWHREQLSRVVYDECYSVYDQLEELADLPDKTPPRPSRITPPSWRRPRVRRSHPSCRLSFPPSTMLRCWSRRWPVWSSASRAIARCWCWMMGRPIPRV